MKAKILTALFAVILAAESAAAAGAQEENWYFVSKKDGSRPRLPALSEELGTGIGKDEKVLYLTFDAGYENGNVEKVVDILNEKKVPGAFFVLSHTVNAYPDLIRKMREGGHLVANHTAVHKNIARLDAEGIKAEIQKLEADYRAVTGEDLAPYFRPPEGAYSEAALNTVKECGYRTVFWSVAYADWDNDRQPEPEAALMKLESLVHNGAVILLHPTSATNAGILARFIDDMTAKGYRFASLEEL